MIWWKQLCSTFTAIRSGRQKRWDGVQFGEDAANGQVGGCLGLHGQVHRNGLVRVDGDGVENDLSLAALDIEHIEEIFDADVVGGECGWIVARKAGCGARDSAEWVAVGRSIDEDDAVGGLKGLEEDESAGAAVETFDG